MKYQELFDEYRGLLDRYCDISQRLSELPKGSIVKKHISGKEYFYLQYTVCGKRKTEYLREHEVEDVSASLRHSELLKEERESVDAELSRLQEAVKILYPPMSRAFSFMRQCAQMDSLPVSRRTQAISFASALTALEGLPAQNNTEQELSAWASGKGKFMDIYMTALDRYGVLEVPYEA